MLKHVRVQRSGFSLIELMVAVSVVSILLAVAVPSFAGWIRNSQVRAVADSLQAGLRLAQAESVRRYRQVVFFRTTSNACAAADTASATGTFWQIRTIAAVTGDSPAVVQCGVLTDVANGITFTGPAALCFNADGRQAAVATTGVTGATCTLDATNPVSTYGVAHAQANRRLQIRVNLAGSIRMCDPDRSGASDGCPN